jgi:16S rRNA (cytosine1402-N4)-methyltransferase
MSTEHTVVIHKPVLMDEVLTYMDPKPGKMYLDCTFGSGGHTRALLEAEPACTVVALDWDSNALDTFAPPLKEEFADRFMPLWGNLGNLYPVLKKAGYTKFDGILADFGTSQVQIFQKAGFSVYKDTSLDMRMSPAHYRVTASHVINTFEERALRELFYQLGEEKHSKKIAYLIVQERALRPIETTLHLAQLIENHIPRSGKIHPATRVFQALRMFVNQELENINSFLSAAPALLNPGGRLVCIAFHSLEDRIVKQTMRTMVERGLVDLLTKKVVIATDEEIHRNPSSRSAKLRAVERK